MINFRWSWLAFVALFALAGACDGAGQRRTATVGSRVPDYRAPTLAGDTLSLAELRGEVVLLNIWATWCPPCRDEMPSLQSLSRDYADQGLRVVAVSVDSRAAAPEVRQFVAEYGITFTVLHDPAERVSQLFRTTGVPESFLIDRDGTLVKRWIGQIDASSDAVREPVEDAIEETNGERESG